MAEKSRATIFPFGASKGGLSFTRQVSGRLRRSTLVLLRWMAIAGQSGALLFVAFGLGYELPLLPCFIFIGLSALLNLVISLSLPLDRRVNDYEAIAQLGFDLVQLAILLWLTGGMNNPFALLFIAPVVTSATMLSRPVLAISGLIAASLSLALVYFFCPLPWSEGGFELPLKFRQGSWIALIIGMTFTSLYAWRSARESRRMSQALRATEAVLAHEQKLSALGGLAAAAAHELGTPLATIRLTAKEMTREVKSGSALSEDLDLLLSQTERCRDILKQLSQRGDAGDLFHDNLSFDVLMEEVSAPYDNINPKITIDIELDGEGNPPVMKRRAELVYGLRNLIENAVSYASSHVVLTASWRDDHIGLTIEDDGPGFDSAVRDRLGEPYVSGRAEKRKAGGLGLGLFISKTLLERTGATIKFNNKARSGAIVQIAWPRDGSIEMETVEV
ncbi:MAG: ActS/PrrB/RegB family redox-sensitive histidine kinase [Hellea sp.]|nr:ActS/PrrB/RegB family redox-sensitive histidine kinase [Hellea sp.]